MKSNLTDGTMFVKIPYAIKYTACVFQGGKAIEEEECFAPTDETAKVYVKVGEFERYGETFSRFVDNNALALFGAIGKPISCTDEWGVSDNYYNENVSKGMFVPINDLREVEKICKEKGVNPPPPIDIEKESLKMRGIVE